MSIFSAYLEKQTKTNILVLHTSFDIFPKRKLGPFLNSTYYFSVFARLENIIPPKNEWRL